MGSVGLPEVLVVLVVALVVLGPQRLPDAARSLARAFAEFRRVTASVQAEVREAFDDPAFREPFLAPPPPVRQETVAEPPLGAPGPPSELPPAPDAAPRPRAEDDGAR